MKRYPTVRTVAGDAPVSILTEQIDAVLPDSGADAIKIGMLHSSEVVKAVDAEQAEHQAFPLQMILMRWSLSLLLAASFFTLPAVAQIQHDSLRQAIFLDSVIVSSYQFNMNGSVERSTLIVDISAAPVMPNATAEKTMRLTPQLDIRERGGGGVQADIGIRGGSPDQTGVLLNGVEFTDIRTGHQSHSLPVDIDAICGMRLLEGGREGLTGAVDFLAAPLHDKYLRVNLSAGAFASRYANLSGAVTLRRKGELQIFEAASLRGSEGYRQNTDFSNSNIYSRIRYSREELGTIDVQAGYQDRSFGANGFYSLKYPEQFEKTSTSIASIRWRKTVRHLSLNSYVSYRHNTDRFELIRGSESLVPFNYHITDNYGAYLSASYGWAAGRTGISGKINHSEILSTVLGEAIDNPVRVEGGSDRFFDHGGDRTWGSVQLSHQRHWKTFELVAALEGSFSPYAFTPLWNATIGWTLAPEWTLSLSGARTMRLPTFTDLYYTAAGYIGNPDLKPEKATMAIVCAAFAKDRWTSSLDFFYRRSEDIIDWVKQSAEADWQSLQVTGISTAGANLQVAYSAEEGLLRNLTFRCGYIWSDKSAGEYISKYAMDYMRLKATLFGELRFWKCLSLTADLSYYDRAGNYVDTKGSTVSYRPYLLLNTAVSYETGPSRFYISADNVTSTRYFDYGGLEMPGLWITGGMAVTLR